MVVIRRAGMTDARQRRAAGTDERIEERPAVLRARCQRSRSRPSICTLTCSIRQRNDLTAGKVIRHTWSAALIAAFGSLANLQHKDHLKACDASFALQFLACHPNCAKARTASADCEPLSYLSAFWSSSCLTACLVRFLACRDRAAPGLPRTSRFHSCCCSSSRTCIASSGGRLPQVAAPWLQLPVPAGQRGSSAACALASMATSHNRLQLAVCCAVESLRCSITSGRVSMAAPNCLNRFLQLQARRVASCSIARTAAGRRSPG